MIRLGLRVDACLMESRLDMATRKRLANRFKAEYAKNRALSGGGA